MRLQVNSVSTLSDAIGSMRAEFKAHKFLTVSMTTGKSRTLAQNSLSHAWYSQVAKEEGEYTEGEIKCLCKFYFGLPILRGDDVHFNHVMMQTIDPLAYEAKIMAMNLLPVTSLMNTEQLGRYLEAVQKHYSGRVELLFPEDA